MKAIVQDGYGGPEVLRFTEVERPTATGDRLLVRVRAAAVNAYDWHVMRGDPRLARLSVGLRRPKTRIRGRDFAGQVEAVGPAVTRFRPGDEVFGDLGPADGAFAEYVSVAEDLVATRPPELTPEQAAAIPLAGVTALQGLRDLAPGQRILINGASGGVGTFALQLAKAAGAEVTGVCGTRNVALVRSLGADHVVDYRREDVIAAGRRYDVVFDLVGNRTLSEYRRVLTPAGTLILSGGGVYEGGSLLGPMRLILRGQLLSRFVSQRVLILSATTSRDDLETLAGMAAAGTLTPAIDRTFPLSAAADAIRYLEHEHATAKVVITV
ncbi:NAD(P)-dependent alcohol dehydrogenase [Amorphoplanes digitatis]|uniref:NADPH:quinone reductase-like Zn-dependent oxidoreductase n=1 Tax=Actinoplanes digitatis TaxID=1868 RepID=A0A7W7I102_9ACTN|nr:NAD(P)-dependent alcohol dehydrogenase [Actinoplanes digitatis]MBB4764473.1 NADPH:quinone reductase-like Zn-dependent oxidoreductase [Actinoplanes digitatis]GID94040.1 NADPH:quinone reductase [Actinoplanes digitatis]